MKDIRQKVSYKWILIIIIGYLFVIYNSHDNN